MNSTSITCRFLAVMLAASGLSGCQPEPGAGEAPSRQLAVQLTWHGQHIDCQQPLLMADQSWQLQNLRFYLSDFSLNQQPLTLASNDWQQPQLALLGTDCQGNSNWQLAFNQALAAGKLSFTLGLPFAINHQNPLTASPPLNHGELFWNWQLGYKFLRLDLQGPGHGWAFHLGSTGCQSASVLRPPAIPCRAANIFAVSLDYQPGQRLQLDLATLLAKVMLEPASSCMSDNQQSTCQLLFNNLAQPALWQLQAGPTP